MQWYCGVDGQQYGPFTWEQLRGMAAEGRLVGDSYVRREADQQWFLAAQIPGLIAKAKPTTSNKAAATTVAATAAPAAAAPAPAPAAPEPAASQSTIGAATKSAGQSSTKLKKAKPLTPVAVAAAAPAAASVPVGQPVPAGVPVGAPVAAPVSFPVGPSVSASPLAFAVGPRASSDDDDSPSPKKKSSNAWLLVGVLGGVCGVVAVGGVVLIAMSMSQPPPVSAEDEAAAAAAAQIAAAQKVEQAAALAEAKPIPEANPTAAPPATGTKPSAAGPAGASSESAAAAVIGAQTRWTNLLTHKAIKLGTMTLQVSSVWLASDAQGTRVNPAVPGGTTEPAAETPPAAEPVPAEGAEPAAPTPAVEIPAADTSAARFVFVEVKVTNGAPVPKKYVSWNASEATAAVLADHANQVLAPVPISATPGVNRLGTIQLAAGQTVTDLLVFAAPAKPVESLKLALSKTALADSTKGHWAFEIPLEALFPKPTAANATGSEPISANQTPTALPSDLPSAIIEPSVAPKPVEPPPAAVTPAPAEPPKKRPPTIDELNKQFEELDKEKKAAADKAAAEKAAAEKAAAEKGAK